MTFFSVFRIHVSLEFTASLTKVLIPFSPKNCYLHAAHLSFPPESAILSAPHRCCHQLLLSQFSMPLGTTFKLYTKQYPKWISIQSRIVIRNLWPATIYLWFKALQIFWPTDRKPLSNLRTQIGAPGASQIDLTWNRIWTFWEQKWGTLNVGIGKFLVDINLATIWGWCENAWWSMNVLLWESMDLEE